MKLTKGQEKQLWQQALTAGRSAAQEKAKELQVSKAHTFAVVECANPLDDSSPVVAVHGRMWDCCGFAWVNIRQCNRKPAKGLVDYLKGVRVGYKGNYYGGYTIWGSQFYGGQEITPKEAGCAAAVRVLEAAGIECYMGSRLD